MIQLLLPSEDKGLRVDDHSILLFVMGKDIGLIYKHSQYQLSTLSLKAPVSSSSEPQTYSAIELTTTSVPSAIDKLQNNSVCIPKTISRMMQPSQKITTYSLVRHKKTKL